MQLHDANGFTLIDYLEDRSSIEQPSAKSAVRAHVFYHTLRNAANRELEFSQIKSPMEHGRVVLKGASAHSGLRFAVQSPAEPARATRRLHAINCQLFAQEDDVGARFVPVTGGRGIGDAQQERSTPPLSPMEKRVIVRILHHALHEMKLPEGALFPTDGAFSSCAGVSGTAARRMLQALTDKFDAWDKFDVASREFQIVLSVMLAALAQRKWTCPATSVGAGAMSRRKVQDLVDRWRRDVPL